MAASLTSCPYSWSLIFSSEAGKFQTSIPYLPDGRKQEWLDFLKKEEGMFVLNASDGATEFYKNGDSFSFTHDTFGEPITAGISATANPTPRLWSQLETLPFSARSELE